MAKLIVIIDDEPEMEFLYNIMLSDSELRSEINIRFFTDAREFFKWFVDHLPDLILTDINMPCLSGPEIIKLIQLSGRSIPTYFVSGHEARDFVGVMKDLGISRFLSKPLDFPQVLGLIESDLGLTL